MAHSPRDDNALLLPKQSDGEGNVGDLESTRHTHDGSMENTLLLHNQHREDIHNRNNIDHHSTDPDSELVLQQTISREQQKELNPSTALFPIHKPDTSPIRTDAQNILEAKKRRLDRQIEESIPEIHIVGQIVSGQGIILDSSDGAVIRWKVEVGKSWQHISGDILGQTHVAYCLHNLNEPLVLSHPMDMHFAATGLQGWGSPRVVVQSFRLDSFGRRVLHGYGFFHLPLVTGHHILEVPLWRPLGSADQELRAFLIGETPSLLTQDAIYESAWKDRARLLTTSSGKLRIELFIVTRFFKEQGIEHYSGPKVEQTGLDDGATNVTNTQQPNQSLNLL